jgi:hypothetical protein
MNHLNCWEFYTCPTERRQTCPAFTRNAGRSCGSLRARFAEGQCGVLAKRSVTAKYAISIFVLNPKRCESASVASKKRYSSLYHDKSCIFYDKATSVCATYTTCRSPPLPGLCRSNAIPAAASRFSKPASGASPHTAKTPPFERAATVLFKARIP